ncbi:MAG TPA: AbfB domain-containing protein, partial [Pilimelia sp.]|nr:AbfB domain-containing protein [Pilimelia sp.]
EDGRSDILVYHDRSYRDITGDPLRDPNRRTRIQKLYWNPDGTPNFGIPVPDGATPVRLRAHNRPGRYLRHDGARARVDADMTNLAQSQFRFVTGLAGRGTVSLESTSNPGHYLRHRGSGVWLQAGDGSAQFAADASFHRRAGLAGRAGVSLESLNRPRRYLRHADGLVHLGPVRGAGARGSATFHLE